MNYLYFFITLYLVILFFKSLLTILKPQTETINSENIDFSQVTIVQPILSGDNTLKESLTYNLYKNPEVNYLWLIDNNDIYAHELTTMLKKDFAHINIQVISYQNCPDKINPKVFKLNQGIKTVSTNYIVVLDDDAMLLPETLKDLITNLKDNDLTTGLPTYKDNGMFWCKLMTQFVNNNSAMTYLPLLWFWKPISINGMCYAMKLNTIKQLKYFEKILPFLADDLSLALVMKEQGMSMYQSRKQVLLQTNIQDWKKYMSLMHRWFLFAKLLLKNHSVKENIVITLLHGLPPLFLWAIVLLCTIKLQLITLLLFLIARLLLIKMVQKIIFNNNLYLYGFSILAELIQPYHLFRAFVKNTIIWRTHTYKVESNERFYEV